MNESSLDSELLARGGEGHRAESERTEESGPDSFDPSAGRPFISVVIPALDEERSIGHVLTDLPPDWFDEVIVADNGSADRTASIAEQAGARVVTEPRRGYGSACLAGMAALDSRAEVVVFLDADFSDEPREVNRLVEPILSNRADVVIGTRMRDRKSRRALTPQQRWGNTLAVVLMYLRFGFRYTDLGPFRAIRRDALERLAMSDTNYGWTVEMQIRAIQAGLRIEEVPVSYRVRIGRSKISGTLKGTVLAGSKILYTIFRYSVLKPTR